MSAVWAISHYTVRSPLIGHVFRTNILQNMLRIFQLYSGLSGVNDGISSVP